jgi:hypothetical protein
MMPYNNYRLYEIERTKTPAEIRRADEQAARLAAATSSLLRRITRPMRMVRHHCYLGRPITSVLDRRKIAYGRRVDATLAWTVVGSVAGVVGAGAAGYRVVRE